MTELRKSFSEEQMTKIAKQAMQEMEGSHAPAGRFTVLPKNPVLPPDMPQAPKSAEQIAAEIALAKAAGRGR